MRDCGLAPEKEVQIGLLVLLDSFNKESKCLSFVIRMLTNKEAFL